MFVIILKACPTKKKTYFQNEDEDLFFHFSDAKNFDELKKDDRVEFCIRDNDRSGKRNAFDVKRLERKKLNFQKKLNDQLLPHLRPIAETRPAEPAARRGTI